MNTDDETCGWGDGDMPHAGWSNGNGAGDGKSFGYGDGTENCGGGEGYGITENLNETLSIGIQVLIP